MTNEELLAQPEPRCPLCEFQYFCRSKYRTNRAYAEFGEHLWFKHRVADFFYSGVDLFDDSNRDERIIEAYMKATFK